MFTGIIEAVGTIHDIQYDQENVTYSILSALSGSFEPGQSVSHDGVCLTVINKPEKYHQVTAIKETIQKTCLAEWRIGRLVNLERSMPANGRFDGHIVQGHVDQTGTCLEVLEDGGSWRYTFGYDATKGNVTVEKGSICVNGVSLTVVNALSDRFSVAIIPHTYQYTNFQQIKKGDLVNLEFDILGKYIQKLLGKVTQTS
jgi:riboflavin synthase